MIDGPASLTSGLRERARHQPRRATHAGALRPAAPVPERELAEHLLNQHEPLGLAYESAADAARVEVERNETLPQTRRFAEVCSCSAKTARILRRRSRRDSVGCHLHSWDRQKSSFRRRQHANRFLVGHQRAGNLGRHQVATASVGKPAAFLILISWWSPFRF